MKLTLAPIMGLTDAVYRNLHATHFSGIDEYYAPFVKTNAHRVPKSGAYKDLLPENNKKTKPVPQLLTRDALEIRSFLTWCQYKAYDHVNLNFGCPYPQVARKKRGSGILAHPELIQKIFSDLQPEEIRKLSVKLRLGYHSPAEIQRIIPILNQVPIKMIILHPRLGTQYYDGTVDLNGFADAYARSIHPVVYNGDIFSLRQYQVIHQMFPDLAEVMLGRGILRNPLLAEEILQNREYSVMQRKERILPFYLNYLQTKVSNTTHEDRIVPHLKEFWFHLCHALEIPHDEREKIKRIQTLKEFEDFRQRHL